MTTKKKKKKRIRLSFQKRFFFSVVAVFVFFACLEIASRVVEIWIPSRVVDYGLGFDPGSRVFVADELNPNIRVTHPAKRQAFRRQSFPADKPPGTFRIATIGGSSVNYMHDEWQRLSERFAQRLPERFTKVEVINAGGLSYGTHRLVPVLIEILKYNPDLVLVYSGHNEFEEVEQLHLADLHRLTLDRALSQLAFVRLTRDRWISFRMSQIREDHNRRILSNSNVNPARAWSYRFTHDDVKKRMDDYRNNLIRMIHLCRQNDVPIILSTVPSNLARPYLPAPSAERYAIVLEHFESKRFEEGLTVARKILRGTLGRHQSSDAENEIVRSVAGEEKIYLADVERIVIENEPHGWPGLTLFEDHCHLNRRGNELARSVFEDSISQCLKLSANRD